jgi:hypothetical protein
MNYGLDVEQLRGCVVAPVLKALGAHSITAENLVLGTAMQESHLRHLLQINGPAMGLWQMEPATHDDIHKNFLAYRAGLRRIVLKFAAGETRPAQAADLVGNLWYAAAMCRVQYLRATEVVVIDGRGRTRPAALPANEPTALAQYWKTHYNTIAGKGTVEQALPHFEEACR